MKNKILTIVSCLALLGASLCAQEVRYGFSAYSTGGKQLPLAANPGTNTIVIPNVYSVQNPDPRILGAVPQITFLDVSVTADAGTPNVAVFMSTNDSSVFAGNNATNDPRTPLTSSTNGAAYGGLSPGVGSNAFWLSGVVSGVITNQYAVIQHQGIDPMGAAYEVAKVASNAVVFWTNSFTNGANQVTALVSSNTVLQFVGTITSLAYPINSGDRVWFEVTNYTMSIPSNSVTGQRWTLASPGGVITGQRNKPLLLLTTGLLTSESANADMLP